MPTTPDRLDLKQQYTLLAGMLETLSAIAGCNILAPIDVDYYAAKRAEYENDYRQAIANLNAIVNPHNPDDLAGVI